jgi:hypothetical protein
MELVERNGHKPGERYSEEEIERGLIEVALQALADSLVAEGLAPATVLNYLDPLRAIFRRAVQREEVAVNPTAALDLPRPGGGRDRIASPRREQPWSPPCQRTTARSGRRPCTPV